MQRGIIKFLNFEKGFGFIAAENGEEVFFHANQRDPDERDRPYLGSPIYFDVRPGPRGPVAIGWRFTPRMEVIIDPEQDRREGYRPGVLIAYSRKSVLQRPVDSILLGKRRGDWTWMHAALHSNLNEHNRSPDWMYSWGVPQGGIEPGESCVEAIHRELDEELGGDGHDNWCDDLEINFLFKERSEFRFQKDGRSWRGKSLYAFLVRGHEPLYANDWMYGHRGDEFWTLPTPAFEGGVQFYDFKTATAMIQGTQSGPKGAQLTRLLEFAQAA